MILFPKKLRFYHITKCLMLMTMPQRLHEKIRHILSATPGLTQRGLAEAMGLDPAAVNRMLYGRRGIMAEEIPVIEAYLGQSLHVAAGGPFAPQRESLRRGLSDAGTQAPLAENGAPAMAQTGGASLPVIPVYAFGDMQRRTPLDFVPRHPQQTGIADAFAYYMPDDAHAPRYYAGEIVYVHPTRPPLPACDCVIVEAEGRVRLARLLAQTAQHIRVQDFNAAEEKDIPRKNISALYSVVGRG